MRRKIRKNYIFRLFLCVITVKRFTEKKRCGIIREDINFNYNTSAVFYKRRLEKNL